MTDEDTSLEQQIIRKLLPWLIVGGITIGGVGGSGILRVDKFGQSDFDTAMTQHEAHMEKHLSRELEHQRILIEAKMPPSKTKARIRAIERHMEKTDPTFRVPSQEWH